jgi:hypothetical protein
MQPYTVSRKPLGFLVIIILSGDSWTLLIIFLWLFPNISKTHMIQESYPSSDFVYNTTSIATKILLYF